MTTADSNLAPLIGPARYAGRWNGKPQMAVKCPSDGTGYKTRADRLCCALNGRYSHREGAYIMSPSKAQKLAALFAAGRDANPFTYELDAESST